MFDTRNSRLRLNGLGALPTGFGVSNFALPSENRDRPVDPPTVTPEGHLGLSDNHPFSKFAADRLMVKALMKTCFYSWPRDYRLLELIIPAMRGSFENAGVLTLASHQRQEVSFADQNIAIGAVKQAGFEYAHAYLSGSSMRWELWPTILPTRVALFLHVPPLQVHLAQLLSPLGITSAGKELRALYRAGVETLGHDEEVYKAARKFLGEI